MEWITGEDVINLTTLCGINLSIVYRKCSLIMSVSQPKAIYLIDEWIMKEENIVMWSLERLGNDESEAEASDFVGISKDEIRNNMVSKDCLISS